ncbi:hypothetical protein [Arthrobacter cryoconiti]|uniref:Lipoprotein n=1 Tax=Arthrobacter cryoconiti TaxID=748907 RepID=A0ABV8R337_9MICC|nr:hypothetical protein [Arthrobacter cryoconiti]MCC9067214.1 hypothetical protein [Arthrobacter cryoconiti]
MKTTPATVRNRSLAALGAGAALMISLTGCLPGAKDATPAPQTDKPASSAAASDTARDGGFSSATARASRSAAPKAAAEPGTLTEPGASLKLGEVAYTHVNSGDEGTEKYKEASYEIAVTKIVPGTEADLSKFKDAAKFAGQTPYYVFTDMTLTALNKPSAGLSDPRVSAHLKDGSEAQKLIVFGSMPDCKDTNFKTEGDGDAFTYVVGSSKTTCSVFLAPAGDAITSASYKDSSFHYVKYSDNPYLKNPITWGK